jgi:lipopolysaccharide transport system permease protein
MRFIPLKVFENKGLILAFVARELKLRYRGSLFGFAWSLAAPLFLISIYTFIFSGMLKLKFNPASGAMDFAFYVCCGMIPWIAFSESIVRSTTVISENASLVKKAVFPVEILPVYVVLANIFHSMLFLSALLFIFPFSGHAISLLTPLLIVVLIPQLLITIGISWFLSALATYITDLKQVVPLLTTAWMFMTPIFYPASIVPKQYKIFIEHNPMHLIVNGYRKVLLDSALPNVNDLIFLYSAGAVFLLIGYVYMSRSKTCIAELV